MDVLATVSAFAAVGFMGWSMVSPCLRRKPNNRALNLLSATENQDLNLLSK
jgi:hypothetical protein